MKNSVIGTIFIIMCVLQFACCNTVFAEQSVLTISGARSHGCLIKAPKNLLVSLSTRTRGKILVFSKEINLVSKKITQSRKSLLALKGRNDRISKSKAKKLKASLSNLKLLKIGIQSCRDSVGAQSTGAECASTSIPENTACDDGNPCTTGDRCISGKCIGTVIGGSQAIFNCGFGKCVKSITQCANGIFTACFVQAAGEEVCNGIDDDCNGATDENGACPASTRPPVPTSFPTLAPTNLPTLTPTVAPTATSTTAPTATPTKTPISCFAAGQVVTGTFPFGAGNDSNTCIQALLVQCCAGTGAGSCNCINNPNPNTCVGSITCN